MDLEGSGLGVIEMLPRNLHGGPDENHKKKIFSRDSPFLGVTEVLAAFACSD
jgi:hypothetical protein